MIFKKNIIYLVLAAVLSTITVAQKYQSDNLDGTYTNPVIAADFPDPDVIRVNDTYYMITTSMFVFPGVTVLKSKDLVNWEYCSNAVPRFDFSPCYNLDGCNRYGKGQWATSIKYNNGKFYLLFITLDEGGFICTSEKAEGPWEIKNLPKGFYDPGLFFDDDGKIYVAHGYGTIFITELNHDFSPKGDDVQVYKGDLRGGLEGTHVYKINGLYYLYCTYGGLAGMQVALRSKNIYGTYEQKLLINELTHGPNYGIHQGALIETQTGEWWTMLFVDSGPFGRFPSLQPVTWTDGWPMIGIDSKAVTKYRKPNVGKEYPAAIFPTSDEFNGSELPMQWGWNHNPDPEKWSLSENPGFLRLKTVRVVDSLQKAPNMLTQRIFAHYSDSVISYGTTKINTENMKDGDIAGLAVFQNPYGFVGIKRYGGKDYIIMSNNGKTIDSVQIDKSTVYFRAGAFYGSGAAKLYKGNAVPETGTAFFQYSLDNKTFYDIGNKLEMSFSLKVFTGNKFCLFNFATKQTGGYADFDWFRTDAGFMY